MMCDLSLATGQPLSALRRWPDRDVQALALHTARHGWPLQRIELTLARLGQVVAKLAGADVPATAFLLDTDPADGTTAQPDDDSADMADFFGCAPVPTRTGGSAAPTQH